MNKIIELHDGIFKPYNKIVPCIDECVNYKGEYKGSYFDRWYKATLNICWDEEGKYLVSYSLSIDE